MGLFGHSTYASLQEEVEKATNENLVEEDWSVIMNICDKAGKSSEDAKAWLRAIIKRLYNSDPHVGLKAVTLLDACVKNSGKTFHTEVASRDFETDFTKLMLKAHPQVAKKLRESLKRWSENEFKTDVQLSLIPSLYHKLRGTYDFSSSETPVKKPAAKSTDPNVVESQEEEEQILKAIELSLKETSGSPRNTATSSLYPSVNVPVDTGNKSASVPAKEPRKVRALYDFEAAEDNELTFSSGEIIMVIDDSDPNWWKGSNQRGEGLFPANFVTPDLTVEPEKFLFEKAKKMVQFKEEVKVLDKEPQEIEINEGKIDRLLHLLHEADPTNLETDTDELLGLEREVNAMGPLIDSELERVDRKHAQLTQLSADLVEALGLYHTLMREPQFPAMVKAGYDPGYGYAPPPLYNPGHPHVVQHHHIPQSAMMAGPPPPVSAHYMPGPPGLPPGVQERLPYHPQMPRRVVGQGIPPPPPAGQQGGGMMGHQPHLQQMMEERRMEGGAMGQYPPGMPNYGAPPQGLPQQSFPSNGAPLSQSSLQNGPVQPHYVSSSTHLMH